MSIVSFFSSKGSKGRKPLLLDIWDPLDAFQPISPLASTQLDWKETPESHVYIADLPGVKKDEVKIEVEEEKMLKISGERSKQSEEKNDKWHRVERSSDKFLRTIKLPPNTNTDKVKAVLENGVLTVTVPKDQEKKAHGHGKFIQIAD